MKQMQKQEQKEKQGKKIIEKNKCYIINRSSSEFPSNQEKWKYDHS